MSTLRLHPSVPVSAHPRPLSAILLAAALMIVAAASITLLVPTAWNAVRIALEAPHPTLVQCAMVPTDTERLACFDRLGKQALQPPAKGGNAPPLFGR